MKRKGKTRTRSYSMTTKRGEGLGGGRLKGKNRRTGKP